MNVDCSALDRLAWKVASVSCFLVGVRLAGRQTRSASENRGIGRGLQLGAGVEPAAEIDGGGGDHQKRYGGKGGDDGDVAVEHRDQNRPRCL